MRFRDILFRCVLITAFSFTSAHTLAASDTRKTTPALLLANIYQPGINLQDYWVSEKLDGVRAYWNGEHLVSRQGNIFHAPEWFITPLPKMALDGELWLGREMFDQLSGLVRRKSADDSDWKNIQFMIFDLPGSSQTFDGRREQLKVIITYINAPHIQLIKQSKISDHKVLMEKLDAVVQQGGEGLMLHAGSSFYKNGRSDDFLKLKKYFDAEAVVMKHLPGKGKYAGMLGSMVVVTPDKRHFKIGSGFSDAQRKTPPAIGSTITYKYFGLTSKGIPRFASFLRIRNSP